MKQNFCLLLLFFSIAIVNAQTKEEQLYLRKINEVRSEGCYCGRKYFPPVAPLTWNTQLAKSALSQAIDMHENNFFAHYSKDGLNIGQRFDKFGYQWILAGENLGQGQKNIEEAIEDWLNSKSHCRMIMNAKMEETGIAIYNSNWVQHFGKPQ